ncbi:unnamed protein product, partial [Porites evermanni]
MFCSNQTRIPAISTTRSTLPFGQINVRTTAKLKSVAYCVKLRMFELRMMSWHWIKMNIPVVSLIVWTMGIRQQHESHLRLEKMCQKRQKRLMKSFKCDPQRQQCEPHGQEEHRDPEINH